MMAHLYQKKSSFSKRLKLSKVLFLVFLPLSWLTCAEPSPEASLTISLESDPGVLDPRQSGDAYSVKVRGLLYQGLLKWGKNLQLVPDLAESYEFLSPSKIKVRLKEGLVFHDGSALDAGDVLATFRSILDPKSRSPHRYSLAKLKKMQALDAQTLLFELEAPFSPFLSTLTVGIIPEEFAKGDLAEPPPGTGPFQLKSRAKDAWLYLEPFADYVGGKPDLKSLKIQIIKNDTTRALRLIKGEVDLVQNALSWPLLSWVEKNTDLKLQSQPGINYRYLAFNLKDPILQKVTVRRAMAMALDRASLIKHYLAGYARPATGLLSSNHVFYEEKVFQFFYNPKLAKELLDEAGYPDPDGDGPLKRFRLTYKTSTKREAVRLARAIARSFEAVGIGVDLKTYEWGTFYRDIRQGSFQMFTSTWVGVKDPDIYHYIFHSTNFAPKGGNRGFYENAQVNAWLDQARLSRDLEEQKQLYSQVQKQLAKDLPYISLWWEDNVVVTDPKVENYALNPDASLEALVGVRVVKE